MTRHGINPGAVFAHKAWFDGLSQESQAVVMKGISPTTVLRSDVRNEGLEAVEFSRAQGATIIELTPQERAQWREITADNHRILIDEIGGAAAALYERIQAGKSAFTASNLGSGDATASR